MAQLTDDEKKLVNEMYSTIVARANTNRTRHNFTEAEERLKNIGASIPEDMVDLQITLNWPQKAVEVFASRQTPQFYSIRDTASGLFTDLEEVFADNNFTWLEPQAIEAADTFGVSFMFTTLGDPDKDEPEVMITARTALTATCLIDPRSRKTLAALEIVDSKSVNIYLPGVIHHAKRAPGSGWTVEESYPQPYKRVLCSPYVHDASLAKPFGRSRVTRTLMQLTYSGARTLLRQEVSAVFYQAPRLALLGADDAVFTDSDGNPVDPWTLLTGGVWALPDVSPDDDPDVPESLRRGKFEQFSQLSMQPFSDQFRLIASQVSGATSIPLHYLGVVQDSNPTSAAAIEAIEVDLVNSVRAQNRSLSMGRRELAFDVLTALNGDLSQSALSTLRSLTPRWADPRTRSAAEQSNFVATQVGAGNMVAGTEATLRQLTLDPEDVRIIAAEVKQAQGASAFERFVSGAAASTPEADAEPDAEAAPQGASGAVTEE